MIKKDKLLEHISELAALEEKIIPFLNRHIPSSLGFSPLDPVERKKIIDYLQNRAVIQTKHVETLNNIKKDILGKTDDVY